MKLALPFERYTLISPLPPAEIKARLKAQTSGMFVLNAGSMKTYSGEIAGNVFLVSRVNEKKGYKRKSMMDIKGRITSNGAGSTIQLTMGFSLLVYGIAGLLMLIFAAITLSNGGISFNKPFTLGLVILPVICIIFSVNFHDGVEKEKSYLGALFEGTEVDG